MTRVHARCAQKALRRHERTAMMLTMCTRSRLYCGEQRQNAACMSRPVEQTHLCRYDIMRFITTDWMTA